MLGSFMLKEVDLPAFVFYDPLDTVRGEKETKGAFWRSQTHMRSMTKESILEESNKFIGQWYRMFQKTEDVPTDYGMAHKTIVGQTFAEFVTNPETEVIMNYAKPWEPFCKLL